MGKMRTFVEAGIALTTLFTLLALDVDFARSL
jgi:hypothetical protein